MRPLPGFWHAAARLSGRLDLSPFFTNTEDLHRLAGASHAQLVALGIPPDHARRLCGTAALDPGGPTLTLADEAYPAALRPLPCAPPVLFLEGDPSLLDGPAVAMVGSRRCTDLGRRMAQRLSRSLVGAGAVVVSGMAWGIDTAAHLAAGGRTIAVLGHGLRQERSGAAARTAQTILDSGGLLVSEFPPDSPATRYTFPQRNRVIAGLSQAVVVVEANRRSGALITARLALEIGREVLAVPGSPLSDASAGCLDLIAAGAPMATDGDELCRILGLVVPGPAPTPTDPLLARIGAGASFDQLMELYDGDATMLGRQLARLELTGAIQRLPGDRFAPARAPGAGHPR